MCKASRSVKAAMDAEKGRTYGIGIIGIDGDSSTRIGALHEIGKTTADCVHCVQTGEVLTLHNIPKHLQDKHGIGASAVVTFQESKDYHKDDILDFGYGKRVQFREFADCDVQVFVGVNITDKTVKRLINDALAGANRENHTGAPSREVIEA